MDDDLPRVVVTTTASVDGRISLGAHQRLLDGRVRARWATFEVPGAFADRHEQMGAAVILEGSGSFVDGDAEAPQWPAPRASAEELQSDYLPRQAPRWLVVADSRGRVEWTFFGDETIALHLLVTTDTPLGYLQRLRDLGVGYFVVGAGQVDPRLALVKIKSAFAVELVVADAGGTMNASLLRAGLVNEIDVITMPGLVGGVGAPTIMDGPPLGEHEWPIRLELIDSQVHNGAIRSRYRVLSRGRVMPTG